MANSPIPDQSKEFLNSGMRLITDPRSDKYLNMNSLDNKERAEREEKQR